MTVPVSYGIMAEEEGQQKSSPTREDATAWQYRRQSGKQISDGTRRTWKRSLAMKREQAEQFRAYCEIKGETVNAALQGFVSVCAGGGETPQDAPQCVVSDFPAIAVSSEDAERVKAHTERTGETIEVFIRRAIADTIKRDTVLLKMGMNPAQEQG